MKVSVSFSFLLAVFIVTFPRAQEALAIGPKGDAGSTDDVRQALPGHVRFERNVGQAAGPSRFIGRAPGYRIFIEETAVTLAPRPRAEEDHLHPANRGVVRFELVGGTDTATIGGVDPLQGHSNYFIGNDPDEWVTDVRTFGAVVVTDVYPGIDVRYRGSKGTLEYDFIVAPGADPSMIDLKITGADEISVGEDGTLIVATPFGVFHHNIPIVSQEIAGVTKTIAGGFCKEDTNRIRFRVGPYDIEHQLLIDPVIVYSTYLGGADAWDRGHLVSIGTDGSIYVAGTTESVDFPVQNGFDMTLGGSQDIFITKLSPDGQTIIYSTFVGSPDEDDLDTPTGMVVDTAGNVYFSGYSKRCDYPTTPGAYQTQCQIIFGLDTVVTKLNPQGNALVYSTYLHGAKGGEEYGQDIAVDSSGSAYVVGSASSNVEFPTTLGSYQPANAGETDGFVVKFNPSGSALEWSTLIGGLKDDEVRQVELNSQGEVVIAGDTASSNFPTVQPFQALYAANGDGFIARLDGSGATLLSSTFLGGSGSESVYGLELSPTGDAWILGKTESENFPLANPLQATNAGGRWGDVFLAKLSGSGSQLPFATYLGGSDVESLGCLAVDKNGNAVITGNTRSLDFPVASAFQPTYRGGGTSVYDDGDAFVTKVASSGSSLVFSSYLGGTGDDKGVGVGVDEAGNIFVTGITESNDFPTVGAIQSSNRGHGDAFLVKITDEATDAADLSVTMTDSPDPVVVQDVLTYEATVSNAGPSTDSSVSVSVQLPASQVFFLSATATRGSCSVSGGGLVTCSLGSVGSGSSVIITIKVRPTVAGSLPSSANVSGSLPDPNQSNNSASVVTSAREAAGCSLTCSANVSPAAIAGATVAFQGMVTPTGCSGNTVFDWDFGDNSAHSSSQNPSHVFAAPGVYVWRMEATVSSVTCSDSGAIVIESDASHRYMIAGAAHTPGGGGSQWRTDLSIVNRSGQTANITIAFYSGGQPIVRSLSLANLETIRWRDVLVTLFSISGSSASAGSLQIVSDAQLAITARTFNQTPSGTFGQFLPAVTSIEGIAAGEIGILPHLEKSSAYRTNIGILNLSSISASVVVRLYDENGIQVGNATTISVGGFGWKQENDIFSTAGAGNRDVAYATVEPTTPGTSIWAYASVADMITNDPTTIPLLIVR